MSTELRLNQIIDKLKARRFRLTPQRIAIVKALLTLSHPTVQQIYAEVRTSFPTTGLGTVYKTVTLLNELGEAFELHKRRHRPPLLSRDLCESASVRPHLPDGCVDACDP